MPVIKRYANRKLYDPHAKCFITLDGIADLIRDGEDVQVIDRETGDDLMPLISAQIVVALAKQRAKLNVELDQLRKVLKE